MRIAGNVAKRMTVLRLKYVFLVSSLFLRFFVEFVYLIVVKVFTWIFARDGGVFTVYGNG